MARLVRSHRLGSRPLPIRREPRHKKRQINMQAIITKYVPPTMTKPGRVKAICERGSLTISWDHGKDAGENHRAVCDALCDRFDAEDREKYKTLSHGEKWSWSRPKASGQLPSGEYVFCFIPDRFFERTAILTPKAAQKAGKGAL